MKRFLTFKLLPSDKPFSRRLPLFFLVICAIGLGIVMGLAGPGVAQASKRLL